MARREQRLARREIPLCDKLIYIIYLIYMYIS